MRDDRHDATFYGLARIAIPSWADPGDPTATAIFCPAATMVDFRFPPAVVGKAAGRLLLLGICRRNQKIRRNRVAYAAHHGPDEVLVQALYAFRDWYEETHRIHPDPAPRVSRPVRRILAPGDL